MPTFTLPLETARELESLAQGLGLPAHDLLVVGDGSGTVYHQPAGWACVAYDRRKCQVTAHAGAVTGATNNFAELAPYVQALWHHHQDHGQAPPTPVEVAIVSDSEVTVRCGARQYGRHANGCLWAAVEWFERHGYRLSWTHVRRNSNEWNAWADRVAGSMRLLVEGRLGREAVDPGRAPDQSSNKH
jgi:ribonuclease HI